MKQIICLLLLTILAGCAYVTSRTTKTFDPKTGATIEVTKMRGVAFLDSHQTMNGFANTPGGPTSNAWVGGTRIKNLEGSASSSNLVTIIGDGVQIMKMLRPTP